jgi:phosphoribosylglycinamide formyltransferase-1
MIYTKDNPLPIAVLISGQGSNLQAIIDAIDQGLAAEIRIVISNQPQAFGIERARKAGICTAVIPHQAFKHNRDAYDQVLIEYLEAYQPELIVLAGFMRILGPDFVQRFHHRILNIHPSLLPKYPGLDTYAKAIAAREKQHGTTVHLVTNDLDGGPILAQATVDINPDETPDSLKAKVQQLEHQLYPAVIRLFTEGKLEVGNV